VAGRPAGLRLASGQLSCWPWPSRAAGPGHPDSWPGAGRQQHTALRRDVNPRPAAPDG